MKGVSCAEIVVDAVDPEMHHLPYNNVLQAVRDNESMTRPWFCSPR